MATRPTTDRLRETLFNVLTQGSRDWVTGARFLDLFAGSGAVGLEALSRGASHVTFVERDETALQVLRRNLQSLGAQAGVLPARVSVEKRSVAAFLSGSAATARAFEVIFLDPPYDAADEYAKVLERLGTGTAPLAADGVVVAEHRRKQALDAHYGQLERIREIRQGDSTLSLYRRESALIDADRGAQHSLVHLAGL